MASPSELRKSFHTAWRSIRKEVDLPFRAAPPSCRSRYVIFEVASRSHGHEQTAHLHRRIPEHRPARLGFYGRPARGQVRTSCLPYRRSARKTCAPAVPTWASSLPSSTSAWTMSLRFRECPLPPSRKSAACWSCPKCRSRWPKSIRAGHQFAQYGWPCAHS